jgi:hypothetical protein
MFHYLHSLQLKLYRPYNVKPRLTAQGGGLLTQLSEILFALAVTRKADSLQNAVAIAPEDVTLGDVVSIIPPRLDLYLTLLTRKIPCSHGNLKT